jgi:bifunctional DNase/RNase
VARVVVSELKENTFFALIHLQGPGGEASVDSRPSDAIALALRAGAPIFVNSEVVELARTMDMSQDVKDNEKLRKWLEKLDEKELGKYEM